MKALETTFDKCAIQDIRSHSSNTGAGSIQRPNPKFRGFESFEGGLCTMMYRSSGPTTTAWKGLQVGGSHMRMRAKSRQETTGTGTERIWQKFWQNGMLVRVNLSSGLHYGWAIEGRAFLLFEFAAWS